MRRHLLHILTAIVLALPFVEGCGDPLTRNAASRGTFQLRSWLRYEFMQSKKFSYGESQVKEGRHVIGYEPSWLVKDSLYLDYPFQLMSDLVIGEYDMNPVTGFSRNDSSTSAFRDKDIVQVATVVNQDINVLLAVTDYGDYGYRREFLTEIAKKNLLNSLDLILTEMSDRRYNPDREKVGVLLDFPKIPWNLRLDYLEFLARLNNDLDNREQGKGCIIYSVLPAIDENEMYSDSIFSLQLRKNVDLFIVRAHDFGRPLVDGARGPMMPVAWPHIVDLDSVVNYYVTQCKIPRNRIVMEVPYYGTVYTRDTALAGIRPLVPLAEIINTIEVPRTLDTLSLCWKRKVDSISYYYEDTLSLNVKYDWASRTGMGGIGIYGLGYGHGMDEPAMKDGLWDIVAANFSEPAPRLLFPGVGFLLCFLSMGIVGSVLIHWQVRYALRATRARFWYYFALLMCLIIATILCVLPLEIVPVVWKLISLAALLIFPLGRKAIKYIFMARR